MSFLLLSQCRRLQLIRAPRLLLLSGAPGIDVRHCRFGKRSFQASIMRICGITDITLAIRGDATRICLTASRDDDPGGGL
jgi:hypothetical protein